jgi:hypothetical protein
MRLQEIAVVEFTSMSRTGIGWAGSGSGIVHVSQPSLDVIIFDESGTWCQDGGKTMRFTNVFRWTRMDNQLRLEHLRFGPDKPVFLFDMAPDAEGVWRETAPHPCRDDCYSATLQIRQNKILVKWSVNGPKRDETIDYIYA